MRRLLGTGLLGTMLAVAGGEAVLLAAGEVGHGLHVGRPSSWPAWLAASPPDAAVFAVLRLAGLAAGGYLLAVLTAGALLRLARLDVLVRWADAVTPRRVRVLLDRSLGVVGVGAIAVAVTMGPATPVSAAEGPPITLRGLRGPTRAAEATTTTTVVVPPPTKVVEEPVTVAVEPVERGEPMESVEPTAPTAELPAKPSASAMTYDPLPPPPVSGRTWSVERGDHFWSIAERVVAEARGQPAAARDVAAYWRALVAENRPRLADPANPDLLFAGQVLALPIPPAPP